MVWDLINSSLMTSICIPELKFYPLLFFSWLSDYCTLVSRCIKMAMVEHNLATSKGDWMVSYSWTPQQVGYYLILLPSTQGFRVQNGVLITMPIRYVIAIEVNSFLKKLAQCLVYIFVYCTLFFTRSFIP